MRCCWFALRNGCVFSDMFASNVWRRVSTPGLAHAGYEYFMPTLQYVDCRVRVGVQHETTLGAMEHRLALAVLSARVAALAALLAGIRRVDEQEAARVRALGFVFELLADASHASGAQRMVQAAFRGLPVRQEPSRMQRVRGWLRFPAHARQVQVLQHDQIVFGDEPAGDLLLEIVDDVMRLTVGPANNLLLLDVSVGAVFAAHVLLRAQTGLADTAGLRFLTAAYLLVDLLEPGFRQVEERAVRQREIMHAATVHADLHASAAP